MDFLSEIVKFVIYCLAIVLISKYLLAFTIRKIAQSLNLNSKTVGGIAGYATSVPELLTVSVSSINGLIGASMYNILSSNIINFLQYITSIILNKNQKLLRNQAVKIDILLVLATILIPIFFIQLNLEVNIITVLIFVVLYIFFRYIDKNAHKLYLNQTKNDEEENRTGKWFNNIQHIIVLILSSILLFVVGDLLGDTLENLCYRFNIPQIVIGILLGLITSLPELITFFESQKHHKEINNQEAGVIEATNNLFTSNILNLFIIQSIGVLIYRIIA